jgi:hypothetical protein
MLYNTAIQYCTKMKLSGKLRSFRATKRSYWQQQELLEKWAVAKVRIIPYSNLKALGIPELQRVKFLDYDHLELIGCFGSLNLGSVSGLFVFYSWLLWDTSLYNLYFLLLAINQYPLSRGKKVSVTLKWSSFREKSSLIWCKIWRSRLVGY